MYVYRENSCELSPIGKSTSLPDDFFVTKGEHTLRFASLKRFPLSSSPRPFCGKRLLKTFQPRETGEVREVCPTVEDFIPEGYTVRT